MNKKLSKIVLVSILLGLFSNAVFAEKKLRTRYLQIDGAPEKITKRSPGGVVKVKEAVGEKTYPRSATFRTSYEKNLYLVTAQKVENLLGD